MPSPSLLILGGGTVGLAAAWIAAERGARVTILERFTAPNERSSHHGETRLIRCAYAEHPDYVALARAAWTTWEELDQRCGGEAVLHPTGGLYFGAAGGELVDGSHHAAKLHDLPHTLLDPDSLRARFPLFHPAPGTVALHEQFAGWLRCEAALIRFATLARAAGAQLREQTRVFQVERAPDGGVQIRLENGERWSADAVVDTRGPGMQEAHPAWKLRVTRQVLGWFLPSAPAELAAAALPCWAAEAGAASEEGGGLFYATPARGGLIKAARHLPGSEITPYCVEAAQPEELNDVQRALRRLLPAAAGKLERVAACQYTMSSDGHFRLGAHPSGARGAALAGLSGHGFKFAPALGRALVEIALDGGTVLPVGFLAPPAD